MQEHIIEVGNGARSPSAVLVAVPPHEEQTTDEREPSASGSLTPRSRLRRLVDRPAAPLMMLALVSVCSFGLRAAWIGTPSSLVFDENYYVNAARTIDGLPVPVDTAFSGASPGFDPNLEHPPLAKVMIAASIRVLGDGPLGWRAPSLLFGSLALLALYGLVRSAGGSRWLGVGAAAVMASDNLFLVHGRIATLDVFVLTFMLAGVALYLRDRPVWAGLLIGVGACTKVVGLYAVGVVIVLEVLRAVLPARPADTQDGEAPRRRARLLAWCVATTGFSYLALLALLDHRFSVMRNPFEHTQFMLSYASNLPAHPVAHGGMAFASPSQPWQWLVNHNPILYYEHLSPPPLGHTLVLFQGRISPFVIYLAVPALALSAYTAWRDRDDVSRLALAWFASTFGAFVLVSLHHRFNYLYYMVVVLPAIYVAIARMVSHRLVPRLAIAAYGCMLLFGLWAMYPFRTWGGA